MVSAEPGAGETSGRRPRRDRAGIKRARAVVLGLLAVIALISLKISSGAARAGVLWSHGPGHPLIGAGGAPFHALMILGWGSVFVFWGAVIVGILLLVRWVREEYGLFTRPPWDEAIDQEWRE